MTKHIVACSGLAFWDRASFSREAPEAVAQPSPLAKFILNLTGVTSPRVCYISTAIGDAAPLVATFYESMKLWGCTPSDLPLFSDFKMETLTEFLGEQDVVWVQGGNTASMLAVWRRHSVDIALRKAYENGTVMCGTSAGGLAWWESGSTDSFGHPVRPIHDLLGWVPGAFCPHYDSEADRRPNLHTWVGTGELPSTYATDDGCGIYIRDGAVIEAVTEKETAKGYFVEQDANGVAIETVMQTRLLT